MTLRISASVVDVDGRDLLPCTHRYDIEAPHGTPWAKLKEHLPASIQSGMADGEHLTDSDRLGTWPLVDGVCLEPARRQRRARLPLKISALSGLAQGQVTPLGPDGVRVGRGHELVGLDDLVSREHLDIRVRHGRVFVVDLGSSNGTRLEGSALEPHAEAPWQIGQHLSVGSATLRLDLVAREVPTHTSGVDGRLIPATLGPTPPLGPLILVEPTPPSSPPRSGIQWVAALAPIPVALIVALVLHSPMMLLFMALGPVTLIATSLDSRRGGKRATRKAWSHYRSARTDFDHQKHVALASERDYRRTHFASPLDILQQARGRLPGVRRCEANLNFALRLGQGESWSLHSVRAANEANPDSAGSSESERPTPLTLSDAPVVAELKNGLTLHLLCPDDGVPAILELVVAQLITRGTPGGLPITVVSSLLGSKRWQWLEDSPFLVQAEAPQGSQGDENKPTKPPSTSLSVVVVDARHHQAAAFARVAHERGACLVWVGARCPIPTWDVVTIAPGNGQSQLPSGHRFSVDSASSTWFTDVTAAMRRWSSISLDDGTQSRNRALPRSISQGDLLTQHVGDNELLRWDAGPCTAIPVGVSPEGTMTLDLAKIGPHALVAGTTGSGKSEFLLAYLRGLFALNSPEQVTTLLNDYKGGATFGPLANAPHVISLVTDLDAVTAARAVAGLRVEVKRRERLLGHAGQSSYAGYVAAGHTGLPRLYVIVDEFRVLATEIPEFVDSLVRIATVGRSLGIHLILATQRPGGAVTADMRANLDARVCLRTQERSDSIDVIDSSLASSIGRDLPGRGYLRVSGEEPLVFQSARATLPRSPREGNQAIHVHRCDVGLAGSVHVRDSATNDERVTHLWPQCPGCRTAHQEGAAQGLEEFVRSTLMASSGLAASYRPILPPLSASITRPKTLDAPVNRTTLSLDLLSAPEPMQPAFHKPAQPGVRPIDPLQFALIVGRADLPCAAAQPWVTLPHVGHIGIIGSARSGRTDSARTLAAAALSRGDSLWWISGTASGQTAPQGCSRHASCDDPASVAQLLEDAVQASTGRVFLVVDGWEAMTEPLAQMNHGMGLEAFMAIMRDGANAVTVVLTGGVGLLSSRISALLDIRLVMHLSDRGDYSMAGLRANQIPTEIPPGRALVLPHAHAIQFLRPMATSHRTGMSTDTNSNADEPSFSADPFNGAQDVAA